MSLVGSPALLRLPEWARKGSPLAPAARPLRVLLREERLVTVCEEARCPNLGECFSRGTATFMLLGDRCTRRCGYCAVATGRPLPPDPDEPARVADAAARLGLRYVVLTAVARDDLDDGGAAQFAATVHAVRARRPEAQVEVLTPDFKGDRAALETVLRARPDVFNHNVEMAPRLFPSLRPQGDYVRSLRLLRDARTLRPGQVTKSGLMLGLGETDAEVRLVLADLRRSQVGIVTLGQYLRPTRDHAPVARYVPPADFERWADEARALGFASVYSGVFVRSSFNAEEVFHGALPRPRRLLVLSLRREGLAALSGLLLALSFPKYGSGVVAWVALTPLLVALAEAPSPRHGFRLGYVTGALSSLGLVYWTSIVVVQFGGLALPLGVAVMVLLCLALALFPSVFGWMVSRWARTYGPAAVLLAPVAWVATEILRAHTLFNFSWCLLGYSQHANLPVLQIARYAAVYGVSFVVAAVSSALAFLVLERRRGPRTAALLATASLLAVVWMHGEWRLGQVPAEAGRLRVGLVQASIAQDEKWDAAHAWANVDRHLELTRRAAAQGARLVVWPESALPFLFDRTPVVAVQLRDVVRQYGLYLLFGNDDREDREEAPGRIWVGAKMLDPPGNVVLRYHKIRLVPFGEFVPMQSILTLGGRFSAKLVQEVGEFTPGDEYAVGPVDGHPVSAFICYEAIFPDLVREFAAGGARLLVNITNDGWYGRTSAPYQHFAMAKFRAVENERFLVRAANTGITAVVDSHGRVLERTELFERTVLVREVPLLAGSTFYTRHGDLFAWACLGAAVALTAAGLKKRSRPPRTAGGRGRVS